MKRILTTAVLAVSMSAAWAQSSAPQSAQKDETKPAEAAKPAQEAAMKPVAARKVNPRRLEDARHCLEKASNVEIIKCAEVYL